MTPSLPGNVEDARHTLQRMAERRITWAEIVAVAENPQRVTQGHSGRKNFYGVVGSRRLRVTIDEHGTVWTVAVAGRQQ